MQNLIRSLVALVLLCALSGCAITMNMPMIRFDSPEAQGKLGKGYVAAGAAMAQELMIVPDTTSSPISDKREFTSVLHVPLMAGVGLLDRLDVEARIQGAGGGTGIPLIKAKYQFLGAPRIDAKEGNFSLAATLARGATSESQHDTGIFSRTADTTEDFSEFDSGIILGYRTSDTFLFYSGPFFSTYSFSGNITQTGSGASTFKIDGTARQAGWNFGFASTTNRVDIKIEAAYAYGYSGAAHSSNLALGSQICIFW